MRLVPWDGRWGFFLFPSAYNLLTPLRVRKGVSNTQKAEELESEESEILGDVPRRPFAFIGSSVTVI